MIQYCYSTWNGKRLYIETEPLTRGFSQHVIETRQPFLANSDVQRRLDEIGSQSIPGAQGEMKSMLAVPTTSGNEATGLIVIGNVRSMKMPIPNRIVALLTTLANSMSVALENARLLDETERQREYFESVVQQSPVAIVLVDPDQNVVSWNPAAERLFGYTAAEALGHNLDDLVANEPPKFARRPSTSRRRLIGENASRHHASERARTDPGGRRVAW